MCHLQRFTIALGAVALVVSACGGPIERAASRTSTTPPKAEIYTGTLMPKGSHTEVVRVASPGDVTATLVSLKADALQTVGLSLGVWTGTNCRTAGQPTDASTMAAIMGTALVLDALTQETLCVEIYDAGTVAKPVDYILHVTHP